MTPEAPDADAHLAEHRAETVIDVTRSDGADARARLSTAANADAIDAVAIGSPHLSLAEFDRLESG